MINLHKAKVGDHFVNAQGDALAFTGYIDMDGDFHLIQLRDKVKKLYRATGEHGGYSLYIEDEPELNLVKAL